MKEKELLPDVHYTSIYDIPIKNIDGSYTDLKNYQGQVLLIVNVASRCGFTAQYHTLEVLYQDYKNKGLQILGFPCNQFLHQEPGTNEEIQLFAKNSYNVSFPLFAKIDVKGKAQTPLYEYIFKNIKKRPIKFIPWNFTKILIGKNGDVIKQYWPGASFKKIRQEIEAEF